MADDDETPGEETMALPEPKPPADFGAKIFGKYDPKEVTIRDPGIGAYMNLETRYSLHTGARHANRWFGKSHVNLVERFANQFMRGGKFTGKKTKALGALEEAFDIIATRTKQNPVQVLVDAVTNAAPREEVTRLKYGGISVPKAVDTAPARRLDWSLRHLALGAIQSSFKSTKPIAQCIADELMKAAKGSPESFAVGKKDEIERVAGSAR